MRLTASETAVRAKRAACGQELAAAAARRAARAQRFRFVYRSATLRMPAGRRSVCQRANDVGKAVVGRQCGISLRAISSILPRSKRAKYSRFFASASSCRR